MRVGQVSCAQQSPQCAQSQHSGPRTCPCSGPRRELQEIVAGAGEEHDPIEAIGRLGARLILQQALEEELTEFLGRERYERRSEPISHRNGYEAVTVKTTAGPLELERPRIRNTSALGFSSEIVGKGVCRTHALEALVVCSFLRGLSVREVEAALEEAFDGPLVSNSTVSRICAQTRERSGARTCSNAPSSRCAGGRR